MPDNKMNKNYRKGLELYDRGSLKEAIAAFEAVIGEMAPASPEARLSRFYVGQAHAALAENSLMQGSDGDAELHLREAIDRNPNYPDLHYQLANVLAEKGELREAMMHLKTALSINPSYAKAMLLHGVLCYQIGEYENGNAQIFRAVELEPRFGTPEFQQAKSAHFSGKHRLALAKYLELSVADIDEVTNYINDGKNAYRSGDYKTAASYFRQALKVQDSYPDVHNWLGLALLADKNADGALECFEKAISLNRNFVSAIINAGVACDMAGRLDDARSYYTRAMVLDPENPEAKERLTRRAKATN